MENTHLWKTSGSSARFLFLQHPKYRVQRLVWVGGDGLWGCREWMRVFSPSERLDTYRSSSGGVDMNILRDYRRSGTRMVHCPGVQGKGEGSQSLNSGKIRAQMCVCVCVGVWVFAYSCFCTCVLMYLHTYVCERYRIKKCNSCHTYTRVCVCKHNHLRIHVHRQVCIHMYTHVHASQHPHYENKSTNVHLLPVSRPKLTRNPPSPSLLPPHPTRTQLLSAKGQRGRSI